VRFDASTSRDEIRSALDRSARETWGDGRADALGDMLDQTADAVWTVAQVPVEPTLPPDLSTEPGGLAD